MAASGSPRVQLTERAHERGEPFDTADATVPNRGTPPEVVAWQRRQRVAQYLVPALAGANIVLNALPTRRNQPGATLAVSRENCANLTPPEGELSPPHQNTPPSGGGSFFLRFDRLGLGAGSYG